MGIESCAEKTSFYTVWDRPGLPQRRPGRAPPRRGSPGCLPSRAPALAGSPLSHSEQVGGFNRPGGLVPPTWRAGRARQKLLKNWSPESRWLKNHVNLSFLPAAFDPQADVQRSQYFPGLVAIFRSAIKPRCAYFSGFKRFSKNRRKVHEMAKTEATVTSGVKNWYIILSSWFTKVP